MDGPPERPGRKRWPASIPAFATPVTPAPYTGGDHGYGRRRPSPCPAVPPSGHVSLFPATSRRVHFGGCCLLIGARVRRLVTPRIAGRRPLRRRTARA